MFVRRRPNSYLVMMTNDSTPYSALLKSDEQKKQHRIRTRQQKRYLVHERMTDSIDAVRRIALREFIQYHFRDKRKMRALLKLNFTMIRRIILSIQNQTIAAY
jgi:hypothetical protein